MGRLLVLLVIASASAYPEHATGAELPPVSATKRALPARSPQDAALDAISQDVEKELLTEKADTEDLSPKLKSRLSKSTEIEGQWDSHYWHDGPHLTIRKTGANKYSVAHFARGDLFSFRLERTATFGGGVLTFDKPVKEYLPVNPYTRFYLLDTPKGPRFASQATVREDIVDKKEVDWERLDRFYLLGIKAGTPKKSKNKKSGDTTRVGNGVGSHFCSAAAQ